MTDIEKLMKNKRYAKLTKELLLGNPTALRTTKIIREMHQIKKDLLK